jgi:hypothetical protein
MLRILFGLFLLGHGLIHVSYITPAPSGTGPTWPFDLSRSALLAALGEPMLRILGIGLAAVTIAAFVAAGLGFLGLFGSSDWWVPMAIAGSAASLLLLVIFWHPWIALGAVIDLVLLWLLGIARWPQSIGA